MDSVNTLRSPSGLTEEEAFQQALRELDAEMPDVTPQQGEEKAPSPSPQPQTHPEIGTGRPPEGKSILQRGVDLWKSAGAGIAKAGFETSDFLFGEPAEEDKSDLRRGIEQRGRELASESTANALTMGISQMVTGLIGAGKLMAPLKAAKWMAEGGKAAKAGYEIAKGAAAGAVVLDPHEERLSNLVQSFPALQNPVSDYLAASPDDSAAEGRFKNALESIGADLALVGAVKAMKFLRAGEGEAAKKEISKLAKGTDEANADKTAIEARTESPAPEGPTTPANTETPPSESPRVKESGIDAAASPHPSEPDASGQPLGVSTMEITDEMVDAMLKSTKADIEATKKFGSLEAAAEAGEITRRSASSLPWQKLRSSEEVSTFMDNAARVLRSQMDATKGGAVLSDAKVNSMVEARAALFGEDPTLVMGQIREAGDAAKDMVANMEAGYLIGNRMMEDTYAIAFRMENGMERDAAKAGEELKARLMASADFMANAQSISSNSGRALRRMRGQFRFTPELLAKVKTMDGAELAKLIYQTKGDPKLLAQTINPNFLARWTGRLTDSLTNSLLWLYPTHVVNMTSNLYMLAARPTEKLLGSFAMKGPQASAIRQQALKEYSYTVSSLSDGWEAMVEAFKRGDSLLSPHNTEFFEGSIRANRQSPAKFKPIENILDIVQNGLTAAGVAMRLPTRTLGAVDEFIKTLRYRAYVQAEAATKANSMGLTGEDFQQFISRKMEEAIDPVTGQALDPKALAEAQITTFQQELLPGTAGATIQMVRSRHPVLTFVLPFVKTPINVLRYGMKMTPGLDLLQKEFRDALSGNGGAEAQAQAVGQMAMGSVFMGLAATMALNGKMTGAGPNDPELQKQLRSTGWQPYSYVLEDGKGGRRFIPMGRLDPVSMAMSMVADLVEISRHNHDNANAALGIRAVSLAVAKNFTDRTFLLNLHQALQALTDPGRHGEKWLGSVAGNTIPFSSAIRGLNPDPYLRDAQGFIQTMMKNLPGYSETLPPTRDVFGEPMWKSISITTIDKADIVEAENNRMMLETGTGIHKPLPQWEGVDLRDITLKSGRNAYDRFQELCGQIPRAASLKSQLERIIKTRAYQDLPDGDRAVKGTRLHALGLYTTKYRDAARKVLIRENPELMQYFKARQKAAAGAIIENRKKSREGDPGARSILEALSPQ